MGAGHELGTGLWWETAVFISPALSRVSWHSRPCQCHSCQCHPCQCHLPRGICQAGLAPGFCIGRAQAKQTPWDRVAFGHSGPLRTPRSPRQEGASAPLHPLPCPRLAQHRGIPQLWGVGHHQLLLAPNPSLAVGKWNRKAPNSPFPPRPVGWSPPHPFLGPHPRALPSPQGCSPLPSSPGKTWTHAQPDCCRTSPGCHGVAAVPSVPTLQHLPLEPLSGAGEE